MAARTAESVNTQDRGRKQAARIKSAQLDSTRLLLPRHHQMTAVQIAQLEHTLHQASKRAALIKNVRQESSLTKQLQLQL